ncbi:ABC transporter permease [Peptoniphilus gorbachii]|uniref:ABC-2 type transport system permease protein n=1 Tax=Peptoniphilus gorbachii TaxID=411567 RepID=A0ABS2MIE2_9FIRM|nr:ABC transporter permease [Peptoniphilus gorbachii]MBM7549781.1 ABC-2 type transport system permease protein [Peptoniphilus gorbachii]
MRIFLSLLKKEAIEGARTKKMISTFILFLFIGLISPLTAKLTPMLLQSIATGNIDINVAPPSEIDSWTQFFKNISQIGMFGLAIILSTQMANEFQKGTLINLLSKGLPRYQVVLSKIFYNFILWFLAYYSSFILTYFYTKYFFGISFPIRNILMAALLPFIFGLFLISLEILAGVISGNVIGTLILTTVGIVIQLILSIRDEIVKYMPIALIGKPVNLIKGIGYDDYYVPIITGSILLILCIVISIAVINKKQIS